MPSQTPGGRDWASNFSVATLTEIRKKNKPKARTTQEKTKKKPQQTRLKDLANSGESQPV